MSEQNNQPQGAIGHLSKILGFEPGRPMKLSDEMLQEVIKDVNEGRIKQAKERAKEILQKAITLVEEKVKREREFKGAAKKFDKEMGKIMGQLKSIIDGTPYKDPDAPKTDEEE